jgi:phosphoglycerate dehydrogenase-like enzyme
MVSLNELFETADVVSLHSPATADTHHLINATTLAQMKPTAILINTSRGPLVDEAALCDALHRGHLFGAALDVFEKEPLPLESPLLTAPRLLLCSHMGGLDLDSQRLASSLAAQCIVDLYQGTWPEACVVNRELTGEWRW